MKSDVSGKISFVLDSMGIAAINDNSNSFLGIRPN